MAKRSCKRLVTAVVLLLHAAALLSMLTAPAPGARISARSRSAATLILVQVSAAPAQNSAAAQDNKNGRSAATPARAPDQSRHLDSAPNTVALAARPADDDYYWPDQLVSHPYPQDDVAIDNSCFKEGGAVLKVWINSEGKVDHVDVVSSTLAPHCIALAAQAFSQAHFVPGAKEGNVTVNSLWFVEIGSTTYLSR